MHHSTSLHGHGCHQVHHIAAHTALLVSQCHHTPPRLCVCCDVAAVFLSMPNLLWNTATMLLLLLLVGIVNLDGHHIVSMHTHMPLVTCANVFCSLLPLVVVVVVHANARPLPFSSSSHALPPPHTPTSCSLFLLLFVVVVKCGSLCFVWCHLSVLCCAAQCECLMA